MSKKYNLFLGQAGQAFVKSEFLCRGWNTAVPDVDIGDDIFVVESYEGSFYRVQVKTSQAKPTKNGCSARFNLPIHQLNQPLGIDLFYVFVLRFQNNWERPILISREELNAFYEKHQIGSEKGNQLFLYFRYDKKESKITCSNQVFDKYLDNWENFPFVEHLPTPVKK